MNTKIGFLGAGHMSCAIINGMLAEQQYATSSLLATCHSSQHAQAVSKRFGIDCRTDNRWLCQHADIIIIGVKPQQMQNVLQDIAQYDLSDKLIITLAAGLRIEDYRSYLGDTAIVRAMPNIAASVQASLTGLYSDSELSAQESETIERLFQSIGDSVWLDDEIQIDGIMALSGSGIAYFFRFMQAMAKAGERYGFEADQLYDIVSLTALGAASLALEGDEQTTDFAKWVRDVAVEGGTTAKAIAHLEAQHIDAILDDAMVAVTTQSQILRETLTGDWTS